MSRYAINIPHGTKDRLFSECSAMRVLEGKLAALFDKYGYGEMKSPTLEYYDTFLRSQNTARSENSAYSSDLADEAEMYKLIGRDGRLMVLRPDNTTPVARVYATKLKQLTGPQRVFYVQNVFSSGEAHTGVRAERMQAGAELIGAGGIKADVEILLLAAATLERCGAEDFSIEIGHSGLYRAACEAPIG